MRDLPFVLAIFTIERPLLLYCLFSSIRHLFTFYIPAQFFSHALGATNRPQELDEAARRRLVKRLYIPLPDAAARADIVRRLCASNKMASLVSDDYVTVGEWTAGTQIFPNSFVGYSGSDMHSLCREASLGPIRSIPDITSIQADQVACLNNK